MSRPAKIEKRCERCEEKFLIPNIYKSRARDLLLQFHPCPYCAFVPTIGHITNRTGRCRDCCVPFSIITHYCKGRCKRCYMAQLRKYHKSQP